jgi:hypothetical protein
MFVIDMEQIKATNGILNPGLALVHDASSFQSLNSSANWANPHSTVINPK